MAQGFWKRVGLLAAVLAAPYLCLAQQPTLQHVPLVPAADWRQVQSQPLPLSEISKYGGDPIIEREYGVKALEFRTYQLGRNRVQAIVETAPDPTAAYGLLTFYHGSALLPEKGVDLAFGDAHGALMARGRNFLRFLRDGNAPVTESDFQALLIFVGGTKPPASVLESLPEALPSKGLVTGSEKYLLGLEAAKRILPRFRTDLIGFAQGAEVHVGQYPVPAGQSTLLVVSYPTPQMARVRFGALTNLLGLNQDRGADSIYGRRRGSFLFLVLDAGNSKNASSLLEQFQIAQGVSWDERYPGDKPFTVQLVQMILAILFLTAILIGACVMAGVIFFLSRRLAAKFFPNWQWGHPDEDQLIRLNLKF